MKRETTIALLGVIVAVMPFLGFPRLWESITFVVAGLLIALLALATWIHERMKVKQPTLDTYYEESAEPEQNEERI